MGWEHVPGKDWGGDSFEGGMDLATTVAPISYAISPGSTMVSLEPFEFMATKELVQIQVGSLGIMAWWSRENFFIYLSITAWSSVT